MSCIEIRQVRRTFKDKEKTKVALHDLSFTARSGEVLSILGPNGAGKTTLIKILSGYLLQTSGEVYLDEKIIDKKMNIKKDIGVVFGGDNGFYNNATAYENLKFFCNLSKIPQKEIKSEIDRVLLLVGLKTSYNIKVNKFSRGMKQRLHIARALIGNPKILLLDEPTIGLDIEIVNELRKIILDLKNKGHIIILTSHIMKDIECLSTKIIILLSGKKLFEGSIDDVFSMAQNKTTKKIETLEEAYLILTTNEGNL